MEPKKVFSEQEAAQLIVEAAKLQESDGQHDYTPGVTWAELQRMAGDVGVDPDYLRKVIATQTPGAKKASKPRSFLGMPLSETFERVVDAELPPENFDVVAGEFYTMGGTPQTGYGGPSIIGRMITGSFYEGIWHGSLEVNSRHGRTRIKAVTSNALATMAIWTPLVFLSFMIGVLITAKKSPENLPLALAIWATFSAGLWASLGYSLRKGREKIEHKLDRMSNAVFEEAEALRANIGSVSAGVAEDQELRETLGRD
ncbi:MAG: hypothetical protein KF836_07165 [Fimbriimonadaceae bacterium]|nr:hypothetical protein [Fimbriimonadaceae bacterium]